jgi:uncharacterized protein YjdB
MNQVEGDGKVHGTDLSLGNADAGGAGQDMKVGETKNLGARVTPTNATAGNIPEFKSSDESVATVDVNGVVTGVGAGSANITCNLPDIHGSVKRVTINVGWDALYFDNENPFVTWSAIPSLNTYEQNANNIGGEYWWYVLAENTCGASLENDKNGKVSFLTAGSVEVYIKTHSNRSAHYTLTVLKAQGAISFEKTEINKTNTDKAFTNTLTNTGDGKVTYTSSDTSEAEVDADGKVTIMGTGTAIITATVADGDCYTYPTKSVTYTLNISANTSILDKPTGYGHGENPF